MIAFDVKVVFRRKGLAEFISGLTVTAIALLSLLWNTAAGASPPKGSSVSSSEKDFGIKVVSLRPTAGGQMLDFRFRVIDPEKAKAVLDKNKKAFLLDSKTGKTLPVPVSKAGPMRQATLQPETGRIYFMLFSNPGGLVKEGGRVSLVIGDFRKDDIIIESSGVQPSSIEKPAPQKEAAPSN
jgi:hypothetical protein